MDELDLFERFIKDILRTLGFEKEADTFKLNDDDSDFKISAGILQKVNDFLYVTDPATGKIPEHATRDYISKFHKFWRKYHPKIINPIIDEEKCRQVAQILEKTHATYASQLTSTQKTLFTPGNINNLTPKQIANTRFFTITQDFKIKFRVDPYSLAREKPHPHVEKGRKTQSPYDFKVRFREPGKRLRTPSHVHLIVELYVKEAQNPQLTHQLVSYLLSVFQQVQPITYYPPQFQAFNLGNALPYAALNAVGEFDVEFLQAVSELIFIQEKTNYPLGSLTQQLYQSFGTKDRFSVISQAIFKR